MKLPVTIGDSMKRKYLVVMFLCFIMGGFFLLNFATQMYDFWFRSVTSETFNMSLNNDRNFTPNTEFMRDFRALQTRQFPSTSPMNLAGGVILIVAGLSIWYLIGEKETGLLRAEVENALLLPEEKIVMGELKKAGGELTQKELSNRTGIPKVKIHRTLTKLEKKSVIKRYPYGMTKKVVIEKAKNAS